ncbi:MAG: acetyl-CoA carboxylase carboxyltransferase subunit beta [Planctomycetes bacterium]|nr:acetyl-CoA carboxylase carboxyltransferase subunit beta [Planctomycetota bacterium]
MKMAINGRTQKKKDIPEGLWLRCPGCEEMVFRKTIEENLHVCVECGYHFRVGARQRIAMLADADSFEEYLPNLMSPDPLGFGDRKSYIERLTEAQRQTNLYDAAVVGRAYIKGRPLVLGAMDAGFIMGSMGSVVGEKIAFAAEKATALRLPLVICCASGGARMMEGILSLAQMAKTSAALARFSQAAGLYISIMTHPTTAGVLASFGSLGDIILAEPGAMIGFTGPRVIRQTMKQDLPDGFQTAEFMLEHGFVDRIVARKDLRSEVASLMDYCAG